MAFDGILLNQHSLISQLFWAGKFLPNKQIQYLCSGCARVVFIPVVWFICLITLVAKKPIITIRKSSNLHDQDHKVKQCKSLALPLSISIPTPPPFPALFYNSWFQGKKQTFSLCAVHQYKQQPTHF